MPLRTIQLYLSDLKELLQAREFVSVRSCLKEVSPIDLADGWEHFSPLERQTLFRLLPRQKAVQLFEELDPPQQMDLVNSLQREDAQDLLQELDPSTAGRFVRQLPAPMVKHLAGIMKKGSQEMVQQYLQFSPQSVGALMRRRYLTLDPKWSCRHALERIQLSTRLRHVEETHLDSLMVTDPDGLLLGWVGLKSLVVAPRDMMVKDLMDRSPVTLTPEMDQEEAVNLFTKYKLKSAPVVDAHGKLLGVVVFRDIFKIASEEVEEDFAKMAGMSAGLHTRSSWTTAKARLPWLAATCVGGMLVSSVIKSYELTLAKIVALAAFSPLISGMGGNVGSQTATVMVRGLATGEVDPRRQGTVVLREVGSGLIIGAFYAAVVGAVALLVYGKRHGLEFAAVVAAAMFVSMTAAAAMGAVQPILMRRLGIDPATATAPFITTTTDLLSNLVYFWLATRLLL